MTAPHAVLGAEAVGPDLISEWDDLAEALGTAYFQTGTWAMSWWDHLAGRPETAVASWRNASGALEAVCSVSKVTQNLLRGPGPAVAVWTNTGSGAGAGDHLGWPIADHRRKEVLDWLVAECTGPVLLSNLSKDQTPGLASRGFSRLETSPTLQASLGEGESWFPGSNDFRKKLRYYGRQLEKAGVEIGMVGGSGIDTTLFQRLLDLHAARSDDMGWGTHFDDERKAFHLQLVDAERDQRGPMMCVARRDTEVVGILYGFRFGDAFAYFQTGWSREFVKQSLGSVLVFRTMEWAAADGAHRFDFLRGDDEYKRRFGARPQDDETWMLARGAAGKALKARQAAANLRRRRAS